MTNIKNLWKFIGYVSIGTAYFVLASVLVFGKDMPESWKIDFMILGLILIVNAKINWVLAQNV